MNNERASATCISALAKIYPLAKIIPGQGGCVIGDHAQIDDFVFINCGQMLNIGRYAHIASFCSVIGGGAFYMEDFAGLSAGCRVVTGTDDYSGPYLTNPTVPGQYRNVVQSKVVMGRHAILGSNCVVMPGVTIGEGATVGAGCIINKDLDPWGVYVGHTPRKIAERDRDAVLSLEKALCARLQDRI
ncbi:MAG: hypothetical protein B7Z32_07270 [Hydrogenophilales bacterium 12-64-13]|nr:MAG: hypothetical protein B7Z32_07270 [Hydrogenophilales bacterium 12-64-13]